MEKGIIGPVLPDNFLVESSEEKEDASQNDSYGPQLPQHLLKNQPVDNAEEVEDDPNDVIGPLPAHLESSSSSSQALNERAELLRFLSSIKDVCADEPPKREEWMTELPAENTQMFGLGSRKFKMNSNEQKPGRSLWTDTPNSKKKDTDNTTNESDFFEKSAIDKRNKVMDEIVKRSKKHKKEKKTLLDLHQEKLKKKMKKDKHEGRVERRPFDRDVDLKTNRFDEAQKRSIISKAKLLDSRFKAGHSKYL